MLFSTRWEALELEKNYIFTVPSCGVVFVATVKEIVPENENYITLRILHKLDIKGRFFEPNKQVYFSFETKRDTINELGRTYGKD